MTYTTEHPTEADLVNPNFVAMRPKPLRRVFKYPIPITDAFAIDMPVGAQILDVQDQRGQLCMWALVDPEAEIEQRSFRLAGTGHPIKGWGLHHIATVQMAEGTLVWHLFEDNPPYPVAYRVDDES